jgi:hypothetical protein
MVRNLSINGREVGQCGAYGIYALVIDRRHRHVLARQFVRDSSQEAVV